MDFNKFLFILLLFDFSCGTSIQSDCLLIQQFNGERLTHKFEYLGELKSKMIWYVDSSETQIHTYEYDNNCNLIEENWYGIKNSDTANIYTLRYEYNEQNQLVRRSEFPDKTSDNLMYLTEHSYDLRGNQVKHLFLPDSSYITYEYDLNDGLIKRTMFNKNDQERWAHTYLRKYDSDNNLIEWTWLDEKGKQRMREATKFDELGNKVERTEFGAADEFKKNIYYKYDCK